MTDFDILAGPFVSSSGEPLFVYGYERAGDQLDEICGIATAIELREIGVPVGGR